ncbi:MarR family transcriptional regulator [Bacillus sp. SM2101]|uniref:MarR family winged helix-turn-helix transcriptional regulator n=1 Tax=Bacillaceae TaxID=186817 RepID=UPI001BDE967F|nr:MarR family transcriptional regulator [Bacillus sp. SM2101]
MDEVKRVNDAWTDIYYYMHMTHKESISHQAIRILQHLEKKGNLTIGDISKYMEISHNTASEHVKRLIHKGYVNKKRDNNDERRVYVFLSKLGLDIIHKHSRLDEEKLTAIFSSISPEQLQVIDQAFTILREEAAKCT